MRRRASRTSQVVTMMRAFADAGLTEVRDFSDPTALPMLPLGWRLVTKLVLRRIGARPDARAKLFEGSNGRADVVALRTRVLDEAWHAAHAGGIRQLVLLGAGLDGRAYRLADLADVALFEVDHAETQALKRARARALVARSASHTYVAVDFEHQRLDDALATSGHEALRPTFWLWEGVTPYLTAEAQRETLAAVARRSAPASEIAMEYIEPSAADAHARLPRFLGEPWIGLMSRAEAAERLAHAGFTPLEDTGMTEWRARFASGPPREAGAQQRIVVARR